MRRTGGLALLAAAVCLAVALTHAPRAEAGACAGPREAHVVVVPAASDVIPAGEGILVQLAGGGERSLGPAPAGDLGTPLAERFEIGAHLERGRQHIALRIEELGPSVARLVPTSTPAPGAWRLVSRRGAVDVVFGDTPAPPVGAAPHLVSLRTQTTHGAGPRGSDSYTSTTAVTREPVGPPSWRGVVVFIGAVGSERPTLARALDGVGTGLVVYADPGRCGFFVPGQSRPSGGELASIALYDLWGRLSPRSNQVRVAR